MRMLPGSPREQSSDGRAGRGRAGLSPLVAALALALFGIMAVGLSGAHPAIGASPTMSPFRPGQHVYDYGAVLSKTSVATAEALATHIEAAGGGRVVIYTVGDSSSVPDEATLVKAWQIGGLLETSEGTSFGTLTLGTTLQGKLTAAQLKFINSNSSPGPATTESWMLSTLARVDAMLSGKHVFDGAGVLDAAGKQQAEKAATDLGSAIGASVYIDIAIGDTDPSNTAFFNGADMPSNLGDTKTLVIALAVSDGRIGGYIGSTGDLVDSYTAGSPWTTGEINNETVQNGGLQAAILAAITAVQKPPLISSDAIPVIVFVVVVVLFSITAPFLWGPWLIRKLSGTSGPIKGGLPGSAVIESIADTGVTVSMSGVGPDAPDYKLGLQVTPAGGGATYQVQVKALVPRLFIPMIVPGARIAVLIDPKDPNKVAPDWQHLNAPADGWGSSASAAAAAGGSDAAAAAGMDLDFDASGNPNMNQVAAFAGAIHSGALPTHTGSAAQILATGTHGTATITSAMPLGQRVGQINPSADPATLNDPVWMFTVEVTLAGQAPFPAIFGHRVPLDKLAVVAPGVRLSVAVNPANPSQEVAIDWTKSPLP